MQKLLNNDPKTCKYSVLLLYSFNPLKTSHYFTVYITVGKQILLLTLIYVKRMQLFCHEACAIHM